VADRQARSRGQRTPLIGAFIATFLVAGFALLAGRRVMALLHGGSTPPGAIMAGLDRRKSPVGCVAKRSGWRRGRAAGCGWT